MKSKLLFSAAAVAALAGSQAQAQSSLFGNRGVNASSGTMNNGVGGGGNSQSGFGNSGQMTGFTGATAASQTGFLSGAAVGSNVAGMSNSGNFVGNRALSGGTGGLGSSGSFGGQGGLSGRSGLSGGRNSFSSGFGRSGNSQRSRGSQSRGAAGGAQSTPIRPVQVISFNPPLRSAASIEASLGSDIASAASQGRIPGIAVNVDNLGTATLHGQVTTETERKRAERLVQLEPGVRKVVNRITVAP